MAALWIKLEEEHHTEKNWEKTFVLFPKKSVSGDQVWGAAYKRKVTVAVFIHHGKNRFRVNKGGLVWQGLKHRAKPYTEYGTKKDYFLDRLKGNDLQDTILARRIFDTESRGSRNLRRQVGTDLQEHVRDDV